MSCGGSCSGSVTIHASRALWVFEAGDVNLYRYVGNRATFSGDPQGLEGVSYSTKDFTFAKDNPTYLFLIDIMYEKRPTTGWFLQLNKVQRTIVTVEDKTVKVDMKDFDTPVYIADVVPILDGSKVFANDQAGTSAKDLLYQKRTKNAVLVFETVVKTQGAYNGKKSTRRAKSRQGAPGPKVAVLKADASKDFLGKMEKAYSTGSVTYEHLYLDQSKANGLKDEDILGAISDEGVKKRVEALLKKASLSPTKDCIHVLYSENGEFIKGNLKTSKPE